MSTGEIEQSAAVDALREEYLRRRLSGGSARRRSVIGLADRSVPLPLSFGQQQMWFLNRLDPDSPEYLVPLAFRLRGELDVAALSRAWTELIERHEILRTRYVLVGAEPAQVVDPPAPQEIPVSEGTDAEPAAARRRADELVAQESVRPFDIEHDWPVRARLLRVSADEHVLTVVFHHVAFDAWSSRVLVEDLAALYAAEVEGRPSPLEPLPVQYADYAAWQREELAGEALSEHLAYWHRQLADLAPVDLPADRPRPAVREAAGADIPFAIPDHVATRIGETALRHGTTPFVVLLAAFQVLIARYTGQNDVAVGTVVSGRTRPELQGLIGYGINNLVLRARWDGDPRFADVLRQVKETLIDAYDHQAAPFARLADDLEPERDMSRTPLYQVAFTMHERDGGAVELPRLRVEPHAASGRVAKCDLELQVNARPDGGLHGQFVYATSLFDPDTVQRMAGHLVRLLERVVADDTTPLSGIDILDDAERAVVVGDRGADVEPVTRCAHEIFEQQVALTPDAVAVVAGDVSLTYAEVNARANRLAHHLRELGAGPESLVGVYLERGAGLLPALLGVLKSGAGYVPLDPVNPADRLGYVLADAGVSIVVTEADLRPALAEIFDGETVVLDAADLAACPETNPEQVSGPDNVIYVIYTSGSTGRPKGCVLTHTNVVRLMRAADEHYEFNESDVWSMFHSFAFDVSVFEMWGALLHGGTLVVVPRDVARSPEDFLDLLVEQGVTVLSQTPSAFRSLVSAAGAGDPRIDRLLLRAVIFAGEKLEMPELRPWTDRLGVDRPLLTNLYGITETTVHTTYYEVAAEDLELGAGNPIGRPLSDLRVQLLDGTGNPAPIGVPGEIHVGGPGVARGYLNRPELTAERFVPDPSGPPGSRRYRSGDLARRRPDGSMDFLGRIDHQVKVRGYRIELGEIEAVLGAHPQVRDAVVIARTDSPGDVRLVAYLVPTGETAPEVADLRAHLGRDLPEYMVPAAFVPMPAIPLTANGKLDRRALPAPDSTSFAQGEYAAPRTPVEQQVAEIWATALEVDRVGVHDSFFDLGGDSIRAVALVGALRAEGFDLAVRDVFDRRTVAELCELLTGRAAPVEQPLVEPFAMISAEDRAALPEGVIDAYPLSQIQTGMVIEMLADEGKNNYHNCSCFRILDDEPFSREAFQEAARLVVARHETLRTSVHLTDFSVPLQLVHETAEMPIGVRDLSHLGAEERLSALHEFVREQRATRFDLTKPTLMRFHAHLTGEDAWWISITECHPIMEGWSYHSLLMELLRAYRRIRDGLEPEPYERPEVRFADSVAAELDSLAGEDDRAYWRRVVEEHETFSLPAGWGDEPGSPRTTYHVRIPWDDLESGLRALATKAKASLKSVMLAAYLKVLGQLTDAPRFHAGLVYDVRPEILGADRVYGMYLNTMPLPFERSAGTWLDLVRQVFAREVESWSHRRFPLPALQREIGAKQGLIEVFFNYQDFRQVDTELVDAAVGIDDSPTEFPLTISSRNKHIFLTADSRSLSLANTERIAEMFRAVLTAMATDVAGDARATFVPDDERTRLLDEWATNPGEFAPHDVCELFERQARRTPDLTALVVGARRMSYSDLDALANRYAHHLQALGAGPESVVGVLLDRGVELYAALLGAWKAGAAYLPLDTGFPAERVRHMLTDSGADVVVTQAAHQEIVGDVDCAIAVVDRDGAAIEGRPDTAPARTADLDRTAYLIYTSGSTGEPKGVQVPHRGLTNHVQWAVAELAGRGTGGAPLFSSIAFDLVVPNLWAPLLAGQPVHVAPPELDLGQLGAFLAANAPYSFIKLTPAHLEVLIHQLPAEQADGLAAVLVVAGEALTQRVVRAWQELAPSVELINEYGPTENSVGTCTFPVRLPVTADVLPIGRPLPNVTMYVLDELLQPVPTGVTGELYVGGAGLARGYAHQPELTAQRFVPDPHGPAGGRLYRTGDVVRVLPDGNVEFLGRSDGQVKIRGYRVELGEIESALAEDERIADVRVVLREDGADKQLVAYLVAAGEQTFEPDALRERLGRSLPSYMVPSAFVALPSIPLNANGKLDRQALPAPGQGAFAKHQRVAPRTPVEERIAAVWADVLGVDELGVDDDFFDLGGDSIRAVALIGALRTARMDLSVRDVFEHRTVAALAALLADRAVLTATPAAVEPFALVSAEDRAKLPAGVEDAYPLSQVQIGMLVETLADPERNNYHNVNVYRVHDDRPFDFPAFRQAVAAVVARHDVLRSSVHLADFAVPMQLVHPQVDVPADWSDLRGLDDDWQRSEVVDFVAAERAEVFDLSGPAPLLRVHAHVIADDEWLCSFTQHHALMDGWSNQLFLMELVACYRQLRAGAAPVAAEPPQVRFADFVAAELAALESEVDTQYWQRVVDEHAKFTLPPGWHGDLDAPREVVRTGIKFDDLADGLRELAAAAKVSLKSVLVGAYVKVMSQLADEPAFHTGLVTHSRPEAAGADRLFGNFLNTLPLPVDRSARTWRELVRQMSDREIEAWSHRHFPMPAIQRQAGGERVVDVFFGYLDFHQLDSEIAEDGWGFNDAPNEFPLTITALSGILSLSTNTHVLSRANADRIAQMFRAVLESMAADVDGDARAVHLPAEEAAWLRELAREQPVEPVSRCVHEIFEEQVARTPEKVAVVAGGIHLTYAEVNARANRLAHHLRGLGAGPESRVGVCLGRGPELLPTLLGVLKSGAGYVPLDPVNPADRLGYVLADAGVSVVVANGETRELVGSVHDGDVVDLDRDMLAGHPEVNPEPVSGPDNVIYVIYTSGSTGRPKGCVLTHTNVVRLMRTAHEHYDFDASDIWSMTHSFAFDVSVFEMWGALLHGGTLVVVPQDVARSPEDFLDLLVEQGVTVLSQTPSAFRSLVSADDARVGRLALRAVIFAGEKLEMAELRPWADRLGLDRPVLVNMYGITETTVHTTYHRVSAADLDAAGNPIGRPLSDLRVQLLDANGYPVPIGVAGEIHVGGPGVARGYLNRPELTAERFVPDPSGPPGARLYRSGDLARRRPDGSMDFLGRIDHQVKIRGYRIELGEVEAVLAAHESLRDAVVIVREDSPSDKQLVAYCVPSSAELPPAAELIDHCGRSLPGYMVPSAFVALGSIPLTANGKLDKRALPAPDQDAFARAEYVGPRNPVEERVAVIWRDVLGIDLVGVHDGFFELGGDSIRAVRLVGAMRASGLDISVQDVFEQRTVAGLAELLGGRGELADADGAVDPFALISEADRAALPEGLADAYPMSLVQTGMVVEMLTGTSAYRSFMSYRVTDGQPLDAEALRQAARTVIGRHDLLRTAFDLHTCSVPMQLVHAEVDVPIVVHDLRGNADGLLDRLTAERDAPFDLDTAPLLRIAAYVVADDDWWLSLSRPHAVTEGWSHNWLLAELMDCYQRLREKLPLAPHTPPGVRYADYIAAELASLESEADISYWRSVLDDHQPVVLPESWAGAAESGESYDLQVPLADIEDRLRALANELRVSVKSVLLAAHVKVMGQLTEAHEYHVGLVCDARPEVLGADRVYGMHLNTVPFAADRSARTWRELVSQVYDREVELWPHRRYPMPAMQREWPGGRLITIAFNYVDLPQAEGAQGTHARFGVSQTEFDITLHCRPNRLNMTTSTRVLNRADGDRLAEMYRAVLEAMVDDPEGDARAAYLPAGERDRLLVEATATDRSPVSLSVPAEIERWAAAKPDAVAVFADDSTTCYADLNARANRLAHHLRRLGVGPDVLVGIHLERSPELVIAVLAVLKAGGAYLPMDPEAPAERLGFMATDAGLEFLLTRRGLPAELPGGVATVLVDEPESYQDEPCGNPIPVAAHDDLAYVIYTSGSTGRPKGAMVRRDGMGNHLLAKIEDLGLDATDSVVQNASPAFDISVWQMLAALVVGGRVRVVDTGTALDPAALFGRTADEEISVLEVVPSLLRAALDSWDAGAAAPELPALRWLVVTGEALPPELCTRWWARYPRIPLVNAYGPTECSDDVTHAFLRYEVCGSRVPIGEPIRNTGLYVLDERMEPVPAGVPGELHVGGAGVGRGYLNRPELTAERFVPDLFGPPGARLYRTGDLVSWRPDGGLDFLGRIDDQVKLHGHRIELGEIETAIGAHEQVRQAVVVVRDERLVAYFTAADENAPSAEALRARLARTLPEYMLPAAFVRLGEIPLTPNGKLDKRALPAPGDDAFTHGEYVAPRTPLEAQVAGIWRQALGRDRVGVRDGFFDLGGDSIRAVALVGALRAAGIDVEVRDVFEARTVERLCELCGQRADLGADAETFVEPFELIPEADRVALPAGVVDAYPLGRTQLGMLIEMMADDGRHPYHIINTFRVVDDRPLDPAALRAAARVLADRHEVLRTSIRMHGYSLPLQLVHETAEIPVEIRDVRGLDEEALGRTRQELAAEQRAAVFDVEHAPLMRIIAHVEGDDAWWVTFTQSHAITEGWSYHQLLMELLDCYRRIRDGQEPEPHERPRVRFADSIAAELRSLESAADRDYWRRITTEHTPFAVPPEWAGESDERIYLPVSFEDIADDLRALASTAGVSMKSVLLSAHLKVLGQLTDEPAFHTGLVCDTRPEVLGADRVLGMYLNTLPFGVDRSARTWRELVTQVFDREVELWPHRRYPMPAIQHDGGGGRLINALFNYLDFHQVDTDRVAAGTRMNIGPNEFDLSVFNRGDVLWVNSHERILSRANAQRLAGMYRAVLVAMAADPDGDARAVHLPDGEREQLLDQASSAQAHGVVDKCVHELFEEQAARTPDAVAVVADGASLTYREVNEQANQLAHHLRERGAGPESLVGVCLPPGIDLMPALLGVLKSGAGYVPLDTSSPAERIAFVLADAGASVVVTDSSCADGIGGDLVVLDQQRELLAGYPVVNPAPLSEVDNQVYVIYTSGSTGRPKGVSVSHANVVRLMDVAQEHYAFDEADVWALFHTYAFDVSVFEMWGALLHGGSLVLVPRAVTRSPEDFLDLLVEHEVTMLCQTPSAFRSLLSALGDGDPRLRRLALRAVIFAGEKLEPAELRPWVDRVGLGRVALVNMYGPTETTVYTTYHRLTKRDLQPAAGSVIGRPLSDLSIHLLDGFGNLVPLGARGEIHVGGPGVARGYLNRPELTAQRFVPDPFGPPGSRLYRTGDLARRRADGSLEFLGRADDQIKIRGYRVELGEIEVALAAHPQVREAVVVLHRGGSGDSLVGYVVPAGPPPDAGELRTWLGRTLPDYMIPAAYPVLDEIPLTPNGKLDKRALPAPDRDAFAAAQYVAPSTPVEEQVAEIWRSVLGVDRIGLADGFFDLGGDSIRAVMIVGRMREAGLPVTALEVLEHQTIAALCARMAGRTGTERDEPVRPFELLSEQDRAKVPDAVVDAYPLTQTQIGMLVEMLSGDEGQRSYHRVASARIDEPFSREPLQLALAQLVSRHEVLRTSVDVATFSMPMQLVHAEAEIPLRVVDLTGASADEQDRLLREDLLVERETVLSHDAAPLLRACVHRFADGSWQLTIVQSHLIVDGWTFAMLRTELFELYRAFRDAQDLPAYQRPAVRFADTVAAEVRALESEVDHDYWREVVAEHPGFALPDGWGDDQAEGYQLRVELAGLQDGLRALASAAGVSVKSVLLAAHLKVLSQLTAERRFCAGLVTHCRPEAPGADRVFGTHLNTQPFPVEVSAGTWRELVRQVFDQELAAWPHRHFPMPAIQREFAAGTRLVQVYFSYEDFGAPDSGQPDGGPDHGVTHDEFALAVTATPHRIYLDVDARAVSRANGERLAGMYRAVLAAMVADGDGEARAVRLPTGEREMLLDWAANPAEPVSGTALELFEQQAAGTPDATAVVEDGTSLSFAELDARANRIAHHLRAVGVAPESVVGVLLDRSADLVATLLGVWKAGAAYVPLDPAFPDERLAHLLSDATALITESAHADRLDFDGRLVCIDRESTAISEHPASAPERGTDPDQLAYVIYTSGSTGRPKGVQVTHRGLVNFLRYVVADYLSGAEGGAPLFSSVAFDMVVSNLYGPLLAGRPLHIAPPDLDLGRLGEWLLASGPFAFIELTPGHLELISDQLGRAALANVLVVGGEAVSARAVEQARELAPGGRVVNSYGPTETTVTSNEFTVVGSPGEVVPIGRPLPNVTTHVLDERLDPVPIGVVGELHVGGVGVARGYLGRPDLTAERFVPDPHAPGQRLYRTGDLARVLPGGDVEFLGRGDDQVKIRGYRVELGEIEAVLGDHPGLADVRVVLRDSADGARLVGYFVPAPGHNPEPAVLRDWLGRRLPGYMVPAAFVRMAEIPLTANGKLDRRVLPAPGDESFARRPYQAPATPSERWLAEVWAQVLEVDRVGAQDRFFELGGHSILVFQVIAAARRANRTLSVLMLYRDDSLAAVAAAIDAATATTPTKRRESTSQGVLLAAQHVPGAGLAVIRDGELVSLQTHGVLGAGGTEPVTRETIFQVGSVSKLVTALGALRLVDEGVLDLDADINAQLVGWQVPGAVPVTLRQLLAHLSGLMPTPSPGHPRGGPLPTLPDLLGGSADGPPVRVELEPGSVFRKANVHYSVVQQLMVDVVGEPFEELLRRLVFEPLGMHGTSFDQSFPEMSGRPVAIGHDEAGAPLAGGWMRWPDAAAAGLWSTPADVAKVLLEIRRSYLGRPLALLSAESAQQMLTAQHRHSAYGLGSVVDDLGTDLQFGHGGTGGGYHTLAMCRIQQGTGFVVITNGDAGADVAKRCTTLLDAAD
ncbi:amino acid adenylation domain-containing protein [Saccharopolyspora shandongensis]|uniref:amino acid adenylation domain-containing protein n=1 Tax=Saccharopolyspora shandongensis TaxID=418495 RepID=UPI0034217BB5